MKLLQKLLATEDEQFEKKIVPYDEWHDSCYACGRDISPSLQERGQFVLHKEESVEHTAAVGLCDKCTRHFSTLIEQWEQFEPMFDKRTNEAWFDE
jgi:hypothetical protein